MEKLLILGKAACTSEIINYARNNGIYTIFTDFHDKKRYENVLNPDEFWNIDIKNLDELEKKCRVEKINGVISGINEFCIDNQIELCKRLNLPCYCNEFSWHFNRDKADFKQKCKEVGLKVAEDYDYKNLDNVVYPVVVKPVDKCSNLGISYCNNIIELKKGIEYAKSVSNSEKLIIERKITGKEFLAYYILANGEAKLECLSTSHPQEGEPLYCYSFNVTNCKYLKQYLKETDPYARELLKSIGAKEGVAWIQFFLDEKDNKMYAIEMGYRMNGDLSFLGAEKINGFSSIKWMVDCSLGIKHSVDQLPETVGIDGKIGCSYILWSKMSGNIKSIEGFNKLNDSEYIKYFDIPDNRCIAKNRPFIFIAYAGADKNDVISSTKYINKNIAILNEKEENMYIKFDSFDKAFE